MRLQIWSWLILSLAGVVVACSGANHAPPPADAAVTSDADGSGVSPNGVLDIVSLTTTVQTVTGGHPSATESSSVVFVAIVTDGNGLDTIAGGQLLDDQGTTYGSFSTGSTKGTYTSSLTWDQMNQGRAIDFTNDAPGQRKFVAKFFDNAGNVAAASLPIALQCRADPPGVAFPDMLVGACGGECTDTDSGDHCGSCSNVCPKGELCTQGACAPAVTADQRTSCVKVSAVSSDTTCTDVCAAVGLSCRDADAGHTQRASAPSCDPGDYQSSSCNTYPWGGWTTSYYPDVWDYPYFSCTCL
jgi:hypothetical protein